MPYCDLKSLETKLEYESNCLLLEMKQLAKKYWTMKWKVETATYNDDNDSRVRNAKKEWKKKNNPKMQQRRKEFDAKRLAGEIPPKLDPETV